MNYRAAVQSLFPGAGVRTCTDSWTTIYAGEKKIGEGITPGAAWRAAYMSAMPTPRCIPHCPKCDKPAPPMALSEYLRNGGPVCCGVRARLAT